MNKLTEVFAELDTKVLENTKVWADGRIVALNEYRKSEQYQEDRKTQSQYQKMFDIAGGKTWYNAFQGRTQEMIHEIVTKHCEKVVESRNASIAKKLFKANVKEVLDSGFSYSADGFNGFFTVNTDAGIKKVSIETILAGGYNVQCLHQRVLVKVK